MIYYDLQDNGRPVDDEGNQDSSGKGAKDKFRTWREICDGGCLLDLAGRFPPHGKRPTPRTLLGVDLNLIVLLWGGDDADDDESDEEDAEDDGGICRF